MRPQGHIEKGEKRDESFFFAKMEITGLLVFVPNPGFERRGKVFPKSGNG